MTPVCIENHQPSSLNSQTTTKKTLKGDCECSKGEGIILISSKNIWENIQHIHNTPEKNTSVYEHDL